MTLFNNKPGGVHRKITVLCIAVFLILLFAYYFYSQNHQFFTYDNISMFPMLTDFLRGNLLLKGWSVQTSTYAFTDTVWTIPGVLEGIHVLKIMSFLGSFFRAGFAAIMLWLILNDEIERGTVKNMAAAGLASCIYLSIFAVANYNGNILDHPVSSSLNLCVHSGTLLFIIIEILILYLWRAAGLKGKAYPVIFVIYGVSGMMSDTMPLMLFFGPLCVYSIYSLFWPKLQRNKRKDLFILFGSIGILAAAYLLNKLIASLGGLYVRGLSMYINSNLINIRDKCKNMILAGFRLFGYDNSQGFKATSKCVLAGVMIAAVAASAVRQIIIALKSKPDRFGLLMTLGLISNIVGAVMICTNPLIPTEVPTRYIASMLYFGTALIVKSVLAFVPKIRIKRYKALVMLSLVIAFSYAGVSLNSALKAPNCAPGAEALAEYIKQKDLKYLYGGPYAPEAITAYTDMESTVIPVWWSGHESKIYAPDGMVDPGWYGLDDIHYIVVWADDYSNMSTFGRKSELYDIAGVPDEDITFYPYEIMHYEQDLAGLLRVRGSELITNK